MEVTELEKLRQQHLEKIKKQTAHLFNHHGNSEAEDVLSDDEDTEPSILH